MLPLHLLKNKRYTLLILVGAIVLFIGFLITVFVVRPMPNKKEAEKAAA